MVVIVELGDDAWQCVLGHASFATRLAMACTCRAFRDELSSSLQRGLREDAMLSIALPYPLTWEEEASSGALLCKVGSCRVTTACHLTFQYLRRTDWHLYVSSDGHLYKDLAYPSMVSMSLPIPQELRLLPGAAVHCIRQDGVSGTASGFCTKRDCIWVGTDLPVAVYVNSANHKVQVVLKGFAVVPFYLFDLFDSQYGKLHSLDTHIDWTSVAVLPVPYGGEWASPLCSNQAHVAQTR